MWVGWCTADVLPMSSSSMLRIIHALLPQRLCIGRSVSETLRYVVQRWKQCRACSTGSRRGQHVRRAHTLAALRQTHTPNATTTY